MPRSPLMPFALLALLALLAPLACDDVAGDPLDPPDPGAAVPLQSGLAVATASGRIDGVAADDLRMFKGIPFARPPVGPRRLRAPAPVEPWPEPLSADAFGPACLQALSFAGGGTDEDCLTLNVWAHRDGRRRPVMVWIYGGGFVFGEAGLGLYDGARLARAADVVVVTLNYRVGVLGYLALPELQAEDPLGAAGNMGLLDQIEALRWLRTNASAFGGDPDDITVFGESAGAISTCALMGSPLADDLFHKAIMQSGNCASFAPLDGGLLAGAPSPLEYGEQVVDALGCADAADRLACLRALPGQAFADLIDPFALTRLFESDRAAGWTIDGVVLPELPYTRLTEGRAPPRPIIAGSNGNEGAAFTGRIAIFGRADFAATLEPWLGAETAAAVVDLYSPLSFPRAKDAFDAFVGEWLFNCNAYHLVRALDGYAYHLELGPAPMMTPYGPLHAAEIAYVFGNFAALGVIPGAFDLEISRRMQLAWGSFARTGAPAWDGGWPTAGGPDPQHRAIGSLVGLDDDFRGGRCDALRDLGVLP